MRDEAIPTTDGTCDGDGTELTIGEAAELLGITVRTLRHWESIDLLVPSWRTLGGHRLYVDADLERAQRILVYREIGLPLAEVRGLVDGDGDAREHLERQRRLLVDRASHLRRIIGAVDEMLEEMSMNDGKNTTMDARAAAEKFGGGWRQDFADEAEARWGDTEAWEQSQQANANRTEEEWAQMYADQEALVAKLAQAIGDDVDPDSELGREVSAMHRAGVEKHYECGHGRQVILARMYLVDERFHEAYGGVEPTKWLVAAIEADARAHGVDPETASWD
ncbi:MerR family transcriptional regulator [Corynebacterium freneyi]|uniref:DNA-binding transcriptional MerR regulator n=1 Tax=Corynebacterium freneyi TaxID=134034 RepID=A0ABS4U4W8_9CORY|nr:MerR family transcriptional regulator [Corynebacterium freneyi]MBP2331686.1 DNA-binding transcriptional MerR regulator [Corynebacterium freneyi]QXA51862.1 MerR family transcriptional regulator [Corynebacterium freneyi]WJZ06191.1 HTH-type transcriptional activator TipA [Corynebacterium freneyi]